MSESAFVKMRGGMEINGIAVAPDSRVGLLIAYLCSVPGRQSSRNELCDTIWPEKDRELQLLSLRQTLFQAQKLVDIVANRHSVKLAGIETDLELRDFHTTELVLKDWNHPWAKIWQEQDRKAIVTVGTKILKSITEPFQKVEVLARMREFAPFDLRISDELASQYKILGWENELLKLQEELKSEDSVFMKGAEGTNSSLAIAESLGANELMQAQLSTLQRLDLALAMAPLFLAQGRLREGFELVSAARAGVDASRELDLRVRYTLIRLAYMQGDRALAFAQSQGLNPQTTSGTECYILGMAAFSKNRFEQCIRWAKRGLKCTDNSADMSSALCSLVASACSYVQKDRQGLVYCSKGLEFARQCDNKYHEVALRSTAIFSKRALDNTFDTVPDLLALIKFCEDEGFSIRRAHLQGLLGQQYRLRGDLKKAQDALQKAIKVAESAKNEETKAMSLDYLGEVLVEAGKYHEAVLTFQRSTVIRRQLSDKLGAATSYRGAGRGLLLLEEFDFALKMFDRAIALYRLLEHDILVGGCLLYRALSLQGLEKSGLALEAFLSAREVLRGKGEAKVMYATDPELHPLVLAVMGDGELDALGLSRLFGTASH